MSGADIAQGSAARDARTLAWVLVAVVIIGLALGFVVGAMAERQGHRQGVIDATRGTWAADQHEVTGAWSVWKVERKEGEDGE